MSKVFWAPSEFQSKELTQARDEDLYMDIVTPLAPAGAKKKYKMFSAADVSFGIRRKRFSAYDVWDQEKVNFDKSTADTAAMNT